MDAHSASVFAEMLQEIGVDVTAESLLPDPLPAPDEPVPVSPSDYDPTPRQLPSFQHLTHTTWLARIPYKRLTHFTTHLAQVTGRLGIGGLPKGIIRRLRRSGVKPAEQGAYFRIRRLLKRWGYSSTEYRRIFAILKAMNGPMIRLTYGTEMAMRRDFQHLCDMFDRRQPLGGQRKNFLSYYLVVQLLLKKYKVKSYYTLPSIKDVGKFQVLVDAYASLAGAVVLPMQAVPKSSTQTCPTLFAAVRGRTTPPVSRTPCRKYPFRLARSSAPAGSP